MKYAAIFLPLAACETLRSGGGEAIDTAMQHAPQIAQSVAEGGWQAAMPEIITAATAIAGSLFGVKLWRGGVNSRKGRAP